MMLLQRGQRQFHIARIVFDQQDVFDAWCLMSLRLSVLFGD